MTKEDTAGGRVGRSLQQLGAQAHGKEMCMRSPNPNANTHTHDEADMEGYGRESEGMERVGEGEEEQEDNVVLAWWSESTPLLLSPTHSLPSSSLIPRDCLCTAITRPRPRTGTRPRQSMRTRKEPRTTTRREANEERSQRTTQPERSK